MEGLYAIYIVFLMFVLLLVTRWSAKRRKGMKMTPEEYKVRKKQVFSQYPELDRFVTIKRKLFIALAIYLFVIRFMNLVMFSGQNQKPWYIVIFLAGCLFHIGVLGAVLGSNWKLAIVMYLFVFYDIAIVANSLYQNGISFIDYLSSYAELFQYMPMGVVTVCLSVVYMLLILLLAIWLTLFPKNRRLADQQALLARAIQTEESLP